MSTQRVLVALAGVAVLIGAGVLLWRFVPKQSSQEPTPSNEEVAPSQSSDKTTQEPEAVSVALPSGERVTFENISENCGVIKGKAERYTYDFFCDNKVFGHADMPGNWHIDHFLSYEGGDELFGFFPDRSGEEGKYYWGPSVLYKANTQKGTLEKFIDVSLWARSGETAPRSAWGSKYFITDVSSDQRFVVYANYFDKNTFFVRDLTTKETRSYPVDQSLYDFGDASFSDDGKSIAFAGLSMKKDASGKPIAFLQASLFVLDLTSGKATVQETKKEPGMYSINGWNGNKVDFEYLLMGN